MNYLMRDYESVEGGEGDVNIYVGEMGLLGGVEYLKKIEVLGEVGWVEVEVNVEREEV